MCPPSGDRATVDGLLEAGKMAASSEDSATDGFLISTVPLGLFITAGALDIHRSNIVENGKTF